MPPLAPNAVVVHVVAFEATIATSVADFDASSYIEKLAAGLVGVSAADISVVVRAASVVVRSEIASTDESVADAAVGYLAGADAASLSTLLGLPVESVSPPVKETRTVMPPPASPLPSSNDTSSNLNDAAGDNSSAAWILAVAVIGGLVLLAVVAVGGYFALKRAHRAGALAERRRTSILLTEYAKMEDARIGEESSVGAAISPVVAALDQAGTPGESARRGRVSLRRQPTGISSRNGSVRQESSSYAGLHDVSDVVTVDTEHVGPARPVELF